MGWRVENFSLQGVRGYLNLGGAFDFRPSKSIAIFGANGSGKSGISDALEYFFSAEGFVEHLGKGGADSERGGRPAIPHVKASRSRIPTTVNVVLKETSSNQPVDITRTFKSGRGDVLPAELRPVLSVAPAQRILRQHDLRRFVVDFEPSQKYGEFARWIGLERLNTVLAQVTAAEQSLEHTAPDREAKERLLDLNAASLGELTGTEQGAALSYCARLLSTRLARTVEVADLPQLAALLIEAQEARIRVLREAGSTDVIRSQATAVRGIIEGAIMPAGVLDQVNSEASLMGGLDKEIRALRAQSPESRLLGVYREAEQTLREGSLPDCPVCQTIWRDTTLGSQEAALKSIGERVAALSDIVEKEAAIGACSEKLRARTLEFQNLLVDLSPRLTAIGHESRRAELAPLTDRIGGSIGAGDLAPFVAMLTAANTAKVSLTAELASIAVAAQGAAPAVNPAAMDDEIARLDRIAQALARLEALTALQARYDLIRKSFGEIAKLVREECATAVNSVIASLKGSMEDIYGRLQPNTQVPAIRLELLENAKSLRLRVDFILPGQTLPPAGYLSESQINSLGIALFLASAREFNMDFPFLVLDDVVSSFDADHRFHLANLLAEQFSDWQLIVLTHDERFFEILHRRLPAGSWTFIRFRGWSPDSGPAREDNWTAESDVRRSIAEADPKSSGNALRQLLEEWLDRMCEEYEARTPHRRGIRTFNRTATELWEAYIARVQGLKGDFFKTIVEPSTAFGRLKVAPVLNADSHSRSNELDWGSTADVEVLLGALLTFQKLFNCPRCEHPLKYDRRADRLYCTCALQPTPLPPSS
jgi:recombinational DNA repair ATPase RecF